MPEQIYNHITAKGPLEPVLDNKTYYPNEVPIYEPLEL